MYPESQLQTMEENHSSTITFHVLDVSFFCLFVLLFFFMKEELLFEDKNKGYDITVTEDVFAPFTGS